MITLKNFRKNYGSNLILSVEQLTIPPGIVWIKGENGSGKTTLFKSLAGLLPFDGDIVLNNISIKSRPKEYRMRVNYSEADPAYPGFLNAKDLIRFTGKAKQADRTQQDRIIQYFGIDQFLNKPCQSYSSGMLKKLSLGMAFLGKPELVILDEPLITLDEQARDILLNFISETNHFNETGFIISSHQSLADVPLKIDKRYAVEHKTLLPL